MKNNIQKTPKIITVQHINETKFYQMPKSFFHNPIYMGMRNESKIAYAILRDLLELSIKNNWINEKNEVYVKLSRDKLMKHLNIKGSAKYAEVMKELTDKELIIKRRVGLNKVDETYVCIPEELDIVYSDEELLNYEESDLENPDKSRSFENQTSKSSKIEPPEVRKSNDQKFENQTHTNTNTTNTNSTKTNINISISSSKGEETSPLVQLFSESICELRKTTLPKFMKYVEKYDSDFIQAVIEYCENYNAKSFAWFAKAMDGFIEEGVTTLESLKETIEKFENEQKKKRNRAIRAKEERAEAEQKAHEIGMSVVNGVEYVEPEVELKEVNLEGCEDISENIKSLIKQNISEVSYNTWIAPYTFMYDGKKVFIDVPNSFTKDILEKRYVDTMIELLATQGIVARIIITVNGMM